MAPRHDDPSIANDVTVLRLLHEKWTTMKGGRERPTTDSLTDSSFENSCFVEGEIPFDELVALFPGKKIARIPVRLLRSEGYSLERRPDEAPENCSCPSSHVVCGPLNAIVRGVYEAMARRVVKSPETTILPPAPFVP
jgi:hypothetical protein